MIPSPFTYHKRRRTKNLTRQEDGAARQGIPGTIPACRHSTGNPSAKNWRRVSTRGASSRAVYVDAMVPIACSETITNPLPSRDGRDPAALRARSHGPGGGPGAASRPSAHPSSVRARPSNQPRQRAHPSSPKQARPCPGICPVRSYDYQDTPLIRNHLSRPP